MFRSSGLDFVKLMRVHYALVRKQKLCDSEIVLTKSGTSEVNSFYFWHSCCEAKHFGGWIVKAACVLFHYPAFTIIDISSLNKFVAGSRRLGNGRLSYGQLCIVLFDYLFQFWREFHRSTFTETFIPHINILPAKKNPVLLTKSRQFRAILPSYPSDKSDTYLTKKISAFTINFSLFYLLWTKYQSITSCTILVPPVVLSSSRKSILR